MSKNITEKEMEQILNNIKDGNDPLKGLYTQIMQTAGTPPKTRRERYVEKKVESGLTNEW